MSDPQPRAVLDVLASVLTPALMTDLNLFRVVVGRMANLSLQYGHSDGSALAYVYLNVILGRDRGDYVSGFRFAQLALELLDRGLHRFKARVEVAFANVLPWTRPFRSGLPWVRRSIRTAQESGDLTFACYAWFLLIPHMLGAEETLEDIQREAEHALEFARGMCFDYMVEMLTFNLAFLKALRGLTTELDNLTHEGFDESACEQRLAENPQLHSAALWYWLYKLQVCLHAEDFAAALAASAKARQHFWFTPMVFEQSDYHFYTALALAASHAGLPGSEQAGCREALASHAGSLAALAANSAENFGPRASLVAAEIARLDGRESDASFLYEQAIREARHSGFVRLEALAFELAARFYAARGLEIVSGDLLRNARSCYQRWGAHAKVRLLDRRNGSLPRESSAAQVPTTLRTPLEELDVLSMISAAQAVSSEIVLDDLIKRLLALAVEHAGAERGLLILVRDGKPLLEAEATTSGQDRVTVNVGQRDITSDTLSEGILHYVLRTHQSVILDDATISGLFSTDEYVREQRPRSVSCQPLMKQGRLVGVLYLENKLAAGVFTARTAVLQVLSAQAAISLENAYLYADLRERESRIRHLIDSNVVGICFWDSGRIKDANDAFCRLVGYSHAELTSGMMDWRQNTPPEYHARDHQWIHDLRTKGTAATYEKEYLRRDGTRVPVLIGGTILPGAPHQGIAFALDLTERKHAELERGARRIAEEANRAKGEFLAKMSHELRTPLNGILGYAQILARDLSLGTRQRESVAVIRHSGEHLLALINDILDLAKIEAGKLGLEPGPLLLADFLQTIYRIIVVQAQQKGVELAWEIGRDLPTAVRADQRRLRQVLLNLLANAVKFTDRGRVSLSVTGTNSGKLRFEVRDTGVGISPEQLRALFQPFEQVGEGALRPEGTGLGLAISRQLVRMMGGEIRVDSRPAQGSCFWFELDMYLETVESPVSGRTQVMTGYKGPRKRVLVIDDVLENRSMLVDLLAPLGFEVIEAANGREALDRAQLRLPDLVLTDLVMPEMGGREVASRVRALPGGTSVALIVVSADASGGQGQELLAAGADAFLSKPIDTEALLGSIVTLLKLDPTYESLEGGDTSEQPFAEQVASPPLPQLQLLHRLAQEGDMRQIARWAERTGQLGEHYGGFTEQVRALAGQYQSRAVLSLIEQHLPG